MKTAISAPEKGEPLIIDELAYWLEALLSDAILNNATPSLYFKARAVLEKYKEKYGKNSNRGS